MRKIFLERCQYNLVEIVCSLVCLFGVVSLSSVFFFFTFYFFMSCIFSLRGDLNVEGSKSLYSYQLVIAVRIAMLTFSMIYICCCCCSKAVPCTWKWLPMVCLVLEKMA